MKLLFLTNFFPPTSRGGYEQWCQEVTNGMISRHHEIIVLTSRYNRNQIKESEPSGVHRDLHLEMEFTSLRNSIQFFTTRKTHERENLHRLGQLIKENQPDGILIWGMWNLPRSLPALAEKLMPGRTAYYMGDYWPTLPNQYEFYWAAPGRHTITALAKKLLRVGAKRIMDHETQSALSFEHVLFPTAFLRDELKRKGVIAKNSKIIYGAVDTSQYISTNGVIKKQPQEYLSLMYAGRLIPEKGIHTAVQALGKLVNQHGIKSLKLTIVGSGNVDYKTYLYDIVKQEKIAPYITFLDVQSKEALAKLYHQMDIFLFTSIWPEPFGRVIVEAMAAGLVVIGTATGGAAEIMIDGENSLIFPAGDAEALADRVIKLIEKPLLRQKLAQSGQSFAIERFDIQRMATEIEEFMARVTAKR
jgi:glycogen(starch) synthase